MMIREANSKPIHLSDDIVPRVIPFFLETIKKYGSNSFVWLGPKPLVIIRDPKLMREILLKHNVFQKPHSNPLGKLLAQGLVTSEGHNGLKTGKLSIPLSV
ncbi:hypothetical protein ACH5RR_037245 [Cinchona calisaya]|uniref:Cytochrome P450 n=1 Tax=Cinchona calisaya TaxID=153742 RepID=A0ABD2Y7V1_9GENT